MTWGLFCVFLRRGGPIAAGGGGEGVGGQGAPLAHHRTRGGLVGHAFCVCFVCFVCVVCVTHATRTTPPRTQKGIAGPNLVPFLSICTAMARTKQPPCKFAGTARKQLFKGSEGK